MNIPNTVNGVSWGSAVMALGGETSHGDRCVVKHHPDGILITVIDGLGHGSEAARAADKAARIVEAFQPGTLEELLARCHRDLRDSRGVVMTVASLAPSAGTISWIGVGNVQGMIVRAPLRDGRSERDFVLLRGGVIGHILPPLRPSVVPLRGGDTLVLATDGVSIEFMAERLLDDPPQQLAERILNRHALKTDDALVLVARYAGG